MGERKVINKHYPQDFDPKKIPRLVHKNKQKKIRFMLPVRTRCNTCGNYMSEGTKFNSREEEADDMYLTVKIFRFYIKCNNCLAEIMIKTYPKSKCSGYKVESGATFPYNKQEEEEEEEEETETETAMESLEKRTIVCKREIQDMATLDEIKCLKSRRALVSIDSMLEALISRRKTQEEEEEVNQEEELFIKSIKFGKRTRNDDDEEENNEKKKKKPKSVNCCGKSSNIQIAKKKKKKEKTAKLPMGLESLCQNYGTDSDDEVKL